MGVLEHKIMKPYLLNLPETSRRFRMNAGQAWQGVIVRRTPEMIVLKNPRVFHGAPPGWFDLCGWDTITITPEMVGSEIAVFVGEEIKSKRDTVKPLQKKLGELLQRMGGVWRVIRG